MLGFAYFVNGFIMKKINHLVFKKHSGKIKVSSTSKIADVLQNIRLRGVYLELRV